MLATRKKRVLIDARLIDGRSGGIQQVVAGIASGLRQHPEPNFEICFLCIEGHTEWILDHLPNWAKIKTVRAKDNGNVQPRRQTTRAILRSHLGHLLGPLSVRVPKEPTEAKEYSPDLVHFVHQHAFATNCKYLYTPHDFQHEHLPHYFSKRELSARRNLYRRLCRGADRVICISQSCQQDTLRYTGVELEQTALIYNGAFRRTTNLDTISQKRELERLGVRRPYIFFPAKTYPHKNHLGLLEAVSILNSRGIRFNTVFTGPQTDYFHDTIAPKIEQLGLAGQISCLGFINQDQIQALYAHAKALVFPSHFEGFGIPVVEAFHAGTPVACSRNSSLTEIAGDAAVLFDSTDNTEIADAIEKVLADDVLRSTLQKKGKEIANLFSWEQSAAKFLSLYEELLIP
ncbi:Glycosyltransferase [Rhodopirellula islandica]|uniref:Glycosyltransferase n=1 Tax=Rhodopirellula islandica TaxID=595434 RepID=A0A0J1B8R6_RHOIS|nr:glycosyltransferase family 1 protein [Rhodopirellula islandica]KLU02923.1 Glycosyltransferase [Rhodopirellula islandica]